MDNKFRKLFTNLLIFLFGSFGSKILVFLMVPFYTTLLSTNQYGEIDIITTTSSLLLPIATLGLSEAIFRFTMIKEYSHKQVFSIAIHLSGIAYLIILLLLNILNYFLKWKYMNLMFLLLLCSMLYDLLVNHLKAAQKTKKYIAIGMLQTFFALTLNIIFIAFWKMEIKGYVYAYIISYFIPILILLFSELDFRLVGLKKLDFILMKKMITYSFPLIFSSLSWWIVMSSDKYMLKYYLGNESVGIYSVACKIPTILQSLVSILQTVWQISTNEIYEEEPDKLKIFFSKASRFFRGFGYVGGSVLILSSQFLMKVIAKNDFYQGWVYAPYLILSVVFSIAPGIVSSLYGAYKNNNGVLWSAFLGAVSNIIINIILIPRIGIMGAAISTAVSRMLISIYKLKDTERFLVFDRGYRSNIINGIVITFQAISLIYVREYQYLIQFLFLLCTCMLNRGVLLNVTHYVIGRLRYLR